jgi:hypothetical protein
MRGRDMADNGISLESVEVTLMSGIGLSSATLMKGAYLPHSMETADQGPGVSSGEADNFRQAEEQAGPDARVSITKIVSRTPDKVIKQVLKKDTGRTTPSGHHHFYTMAFIMSLRPGDPTTTHLINGMIEFVFPEETEILEYSPKDKSSITILLENGGDAISLDQNLVFRVPADRDTMVSQDNPENRFVIPGGSGEKITGTYSAKNGYLFAIPAALLLEYQGILKNQHEMFWEIYPPMPPHDREFPRSAMLAVFSVVIRTPKKVPPEIRVIMECRMKGNIWGVIPLKSIVDIA